MTNNQLTLEQAIQHTDEKAAALSGPCAEQHKQLAEWLRELQEYRKAAMDSKPVAWTWHHFKQWHVTNDEERARDLAWDGVKIEPLYRHAQPALVVMDDEKLRTLFDAWFASDCSFDQSPEASEADNIAWRESYWYVWQRCRAAMLAAAPQEEK